MSAKKKPMSFADQARAIAAQASKDDLAQALKDLAKGLVPRRAPNRFVTPAVISRLPPMVRAPRRGARRVGRSQAYTATGKFNTARRGTWRHFMINMITRHTDTSAANTAHALSGEHGDKKLDFRWAADNGYIQFV